ncbi:MAG: hypothetical protein NTW28_30100 [Candidatus Solibacter sp.]|nr:hypothetical protein [Candidatus Solibacter sp.]
MKNPISGKAVFFALGAAALFWVAPASAQVSTMRLDIPFTFVAGDQVFPAGQYFVSVDQDFRRCRFDNLSDSAIRMIRISPETDRRPMEKAEQGTLRFTRYGGQHFLSNVWRPGQEQGNRVVASKRLLEAAKSKGGDGSPTLVTVVAPN